MLEPDNVQVVTRPELFRQRIESFTVPAGTTLRDIVVRALPERILQAHAVVFLDGERIPAEWLHLVKPRGGHLVNIALAPAGGDLFNTNNIRAVLSAIIGFGGPWVSNALGGPLGWIAGTAITLGGFLLLQALLPPQDITPVEAGFELTGGRNAVEQYGAFTKVYGKNRVTPKFAAMPYTEVSGEDQFARFLLCVGYGPLKLSEIKIGDTLIQNPDGTTNFEGVEVEIREGRADDRPLTLITNDVEQDSFSVMITKTDGPITRTTGTDADEISVDVTFPSGLWRNAGGDRAPWTVNLKIQYRLTGTGEDAWLEIDEVLAADLATLASTQDVTALTAELLALNTAVAAELAAIAGISPADQTITVDTKNTLIGRIQQVLAVLNTTPDQGSGTLATQIADAITHFEGLDTAIGAFFITPFDSLVLTTLHHTDILSTIVDAFSIWDGINQYQGRGYGPALSTFPRWAQWIIRRRGLAAIFGDPDPEAIRITADSPTRVIKSFRWLVTPGQYDVRVYRLTDDNKDPDDPDAVPVNADVTDEVYFTALRTVRYGSPINFDLVPPMALIAMRVKASSALSNSLDTVSVIAEAYLPVPTFDEDAETWSWSEQLTRSHAWAFYDNFCGPQAIKKINATLPTTDADSLIDLHDLAAWATDLAAEVFKVADSDDLVGRTFDAVIDKQLPMDQLARNIAAAGRAAYTIFDDLHTIVQDKPKDKTQDFTPANMWGFQMERTHAVLPDALRVFFIDASNSYTRQETPCFNDGFDVTNAEVYETFETFGATDFRQAWTDARYSYQAAILRPRIYSWNTWTDWIVCRMGDRATVSHPVPLWGLGTNGWIHAITYNGGTNKTTVVFRATVPMLAATAYAIRVVYPDGYSVEMTVDNVGSSGEYDRVTFTGALGASVASDLSPGGVSAGKGSRYLFGPVGNVGHDVIVREIESFADKTARITALDYSPDIYRDPNDPIPPFDAGTVIQPPIEGPRPQTPVLEVFPTGHPRAGEAVIVTDESVLYESNGGTLEPQIMIGIVPPVVGFNDLAPDFLEVQIRRIADVAGDDPVNVFPWIPQPRASWEVATYFIQPVEERRTYAIRLRYITRDGRTGDWLTVSSVYVIGKTSPPPDVLVLTLTGTQLQWRYPNPPRDFGGFILKWIPGEFTETVWDENVCQQITDGIITDTAFNIAGFLGGTKTFLVRAIDTSGNLSTHAAVLVSEIGDPSVFNVIDSYDWKANDWTPAGFIDGEILPEGLAAPFDPADLFWKGGATGLFWGVRGGSTDRFWNFRWGGLIFIFPYIPPTGSDGSALTFDIVMENGHGTLLYNEAPASIDIGQMQPFPGTINVKEGTTYQFVYIGFGEDPINRPILTTFISNLDVPDVVEHFEDLVITVAADGIRLPITKTYRQILGVNATLHADGGTAVTLKIVDKGSPSSTDPTDGPLIKAYDVAGAETTASLDAQVWGF